MFMILESVIHTWMTQAHNWSEWLSEHFSFSKPPRLDPFQAELDKSLWSEVAFQAFPLQKGLFLMSRDEKGESSERSFSFLWPSAILWYSMLCKDGLERPADSV